jgi:hypothetical protein
MKIKPKTRKKTIQRKNAKGQKKKKKIHKNKTNRKIKS